MSQYPRAAIVLATVGALAATDARAQPTPMSVPTAVAPLNSAAADVDLGSVDTGPPASPTRRARHAIYVEALGRAGGVAGLGYGYQISRRVGVGAVGSINLLDGQRLYSLSPFVTLYPVGGARHRWFVEAGPHLARLVTPSPVPEWSGTSSNGVGGQLTTGYEYRRHVLTRVFAMVEVGRGGVAPWFGVDLGWSL
ncbi:MAG: hypothetical protein IPH44_24780 [Myxococcales bacterium]|nr:hypothetical protein [Myxococcales bacterium]MBK7191618.1 hypothetical protein [Myxococcales bacterium]MBP6846076.1 hypothetical protein [Kofleriaceae bacterium]